MAKTKEPINPFYILLVLLGVVFVVTTCGYATMTWRATQPVATYEARQPETEGEAAAAESISDNHPLMVLLDQYGIELLGGELLLLALATFGAMGLDSLRTRQAERRANASNPAKDAAGDAMRQNVG